LGDRDTRVGLRAHQKRRDFAGGDLYITNLNVCDPERKAGCDPKRKFRTAKSGHKKSTKQTVNVGRVSGARRSAATAGKRPLATAG
jgi:hypothetical protein